MGPPRVCQESWYRKTIFSSLINWILEISEFLTPWFFFNKLCLLLQDIHLRPMSSLNYMKKALRLVIICFILKWILPDILQWCWTKLCFIFWFLFVAKFRKRFDKLRKKRDEIERHLENARQKLKEMQKENNLLKSQVAHLDSLVLRALCKICLVSEVAVLFQPCEHAVFCWSCHERSMAGNSKRARTCNICNCPIKTTKNLILA